MGAELGWHVDHRGIFALQGWPPFYTIYITNIMREGNRQQSEKSESGSDELLRAHQGENPSMNRLAKTVNFLFSAIASFCTFWVLFRSEAHDITPNDFGKNRRDDRIQ
ncbi:MAG: hypothetical protein HGB15_02935 [Chlorobaculum sp.]|nr:hypothetical protein [Chlorobaculum sp.]